MKEVTQELVRVPGERQLSGELSYPLESPRAACMLVSPHPYMGGTMDNNVIRAIASAFPSNGIATLRFDYSGVGASEGAAVDVTAAMMEFWSNGSAPLDPIFIEDASAALSWLRSQMQQRIFVIGYSFGAYVATRISTRDIAGLALISPAIAHHQFSDRLAPGTPKLVVYSDDDFVADEQTFANWLGRLPGPCESRCIRGAQHFFVGHEQLLAEVCLDFVAGILHESECAR